MQKRQIFFLYFLFLSLVLYIWLWLWIFLDYYICEIFPEFLTCIPRIEWAKNYWYIYQELYILISIVIFFLFYSLIYFKITKNKTTK